LESPPPVRLYQPGSWGPISVHQLIAPMPRERATFVATHQAGIAHHIGGNDGC
jgi:hypothetical protein